METFFVCLFAAIHKLFFITFLLTSTIYMALSIYLLRHRITPPSALEVKSGRYKLRLFVTTLLAVVGAVCFFARHNNYCEPMSMEIFLGGKIPASP